MSTTTTATPPTSIILLKTPSPDPISDPYTLHLSSSPPPPTTTTTTTTFVPVLSHTLLPDPLITLLLTHFSSSSRPPRPPNNNHHSDPDPQDPQQQQPPPPFPYGALIFTSQRSVAAFAAALSAPAVRRVEERVRSGFSAVRLYAVGPATERAVRAVVREERLGGDGGRGCEVYGGEGAGSGEMLARMMLGGEQGGGGGGGAYYGVREGEEGKGRKKPVLFLVGEKRRDVIPRMLMDPGLPEGERVQVVEMEVYRTGQLEEFEFHFTQTLARMGAAEGVVWVVVFSPTAGEGMLRGLGWLDGANGRANARARDADRKTFVACIGPTTRDYLEREFGFEPDVVAKKPSPLGVKEGIENFMKERGL